MAKRKIKWSIAARLDLFDILEFYVNKNKSNSYSRKLNAKINNSIRFIVQNPFIGTHSNIDAVRALITE